MNLNPRSERKEATKFLYGLCIFLAIMLGFPSIINLWFSFNEVTFHNLTGEGFAGIENYGFSSTYGCNVSFNFK